MFMNLNMTEMFYHGPGLRVNSKNINIGFAKVPAVKMWSE